MIDLLKRTLDAHRDEYLKPLLDLGRLDTHCLGHGIDGGLEKAGQDYIAKLMGDMGAEVRVVPMKEADIQAAIAQYHDGNPGHNYDDRANVYGRFAGGGGRSIMFNGHMDTMPAQAELWATDPWTPTLKDGKLYGLGIADMKSGLAAAVMAVKLLRDAGLELPGDVIITSVADEEGGGNGSIAAAIQGEKADAVVVCEGTKNHWRVFSSAADTWTNLEWETTLRDSRNAFFDTVDNCMYYHVADEQFWSRVDFVAADV